MRGKIGFNHGSGSTLMPGLTLSISICELLSTNIVSSPVTIVLVSPSETITVVGVLMFTGTFSDVLNILDETVLK